MSDHSRAEHHGAVSEERGRELTALRRRAAVWERAYEDLYRQHSALLAELTTAQTAMARVQKGPRPVPPSTVRERAERAE